MIKIHRHRLHLCHALREALPDHSIVCGAPRYPFIRIDLGERIRGSSGFGDDGKAIDPRKGTSSWTRPPIGARWIEWDHVRGQDIITVREYEMVPVYMRSTVASAERTIARIEPPVWLGLDCWTRQAVEAMKSVATEWLRPVPPEQIESQLKGNERLEIQIRPLEPMPEPKRRAVRR